MKNIFEDSAWKGAAKFTLCILPLIIISGIALAYYELGTGLADVVNMPKGTFIVVTVSQILLYSVISAFVGYFFADKMGLKRDFKLRKQETIFSCVLGIISGFLFFAVDYYVFAPQMPKVSQYYFTYPFSLSYILSEIIYSGIIEELLMRWFLMSFVSFILWKVYKHKIKDNTVPDFIFIAANIIIAFIFSFGHVQTTIVFWGNFSLMMFIRCVLLNGSLGVIFGEIYRKHGIQYAMLSHVLMYICCDVPLFMVTKAIS